MNTAAVASSSVRAGSRRTEIGGEQPGGENHTKGGDHLAGSELNISGPALFLHGSTIKQKNLQSNKKNKLAKQKKLRKNAEHFSRGQGP